MRTPKEIKNGLECYINHGECEKHPRCDGCPFKVYTAGDVLGNVPIRDALALIQQLESSYGQVSKALVGKENAALEEVLQTVDQVKQNKPGKKLICEIAIDGEDIRKALVEVELDGKTFAEWVELVKGYKQLEAELEAVRRERDAAVADLGPDCCTCKHKGETERCRWSPCGYEWRGVCPDTEVQE